MANMFSGHKTKTVPKTLDECIQIDPVSQNLWTWAERLETWGKILFFIIIFAGIITTIVTGVETAEYLETVEHLKYDYYDNEVIKQPSVFDVVVASMLEWALYAFLEYITYHALALLMGALASITQNSVISANVAMLDASTNIRIPKSSPSNNEEDIKRDAPSISSVKQQVSQIPVKEKSFDDGSWICTCGRRNASYISSCACGKSKHDMKFQ